LGKEYQRSYKHQIHATDVQIGAIDGGMRLSRGLADDGYLRHRQNAPDTPPLQSSASSTGLRASAQAESDIF